MAKLCENLDAFCSAVSDGPPKGSEVLSRVVGKWSQKPDAARRRIGRQGEIAVDLGMERIEETWLASKMIRSVKVVRLGDGRSRRRRPSRT